jgi:hypothetical protein
MSSKYVEGVGLVALDPNKSEEEQQATIDYWKTITPRQKELTFATGFTDNQSIIYRQFEQKFLNTEDESKRQWFEDQAKEFGQQVGYYDSIALEGYYDKIAGARDLSEDEEQMRSSNMATMQEFQKDMYQAYENRSGDTTDVQKKYGYTAEDIDILDGLTMMAQNPSYTIGSLTSMVVKDPELLLLSYLRIPQAIARTNQAIMNTTRLATKIKPAYVQRFESMVGRGGEGAAYGVTYEALHDITYKGYIDPDNIERGAAAGFLLGTAFGAVTKTPSGSWLTNRLGSKKAAKNIEGGKSKIKSETKDGKTVLKRQEVVPEKEMPALPKGLNHETRYSKWHEWMIGKSNTKLEKWASDKNIGFNKVSQVKKEHIKSIDDKIDGYVDMLKVEYPNLSSAEIRGMAAKSVAALYRSKNRKVQPTTKKEKEAAIRDAETKIQQKEKQWGKEAIERGDETLPPERFVKEFEHPTGGTLPKAPVESLVKWGAVGAVGGYASFDENPVLSTVLGGVLAAGTRGKIRGINRDVLKLRQHVYKEADRTKVMMKDFESQATMAMTKIKQLFETTKEQTDFLYVLEKPTKDASPKAKRRYAERMKKMTPEQKDAIKIWQETMSNFKKAAIKANIFEEGFIKEYVTHIFKGKEPPKDAHANFSKILSKHSKFGQQRTILKTIEEIALKGKYDIETDPLKILSIYTHSMGKAITGAELVKGLTKSAILDGESKISLIIPTTEKSSLGLAKRLGYKTTDHPALRGKQIHPVVKDAIEDFFHVDVGTNLFMDKVLIFNNAMKRLAVSMSLFHAQALVLSGLYAGMFSPSLYTKAGKLRMQRVRDLMDAKRVDGKFVEADLAKEMNLHGVETGVGKTSQLVNPGYDTVKNFFDKFLPRVSKVQDKLDEWTWTKGHDQMKMYSYLLKKEQAMKVGVKEKDAGAMAALFVNDAFGGQNWQKLAIGFQEKALKHADSPKGWLYDAMATATAPSKLKWANLGVFAPDWTVSNFRIVFRGLALGKHNAIKRLVKGQKLTPEEKAVFSMYKSYLVRAGLVTTALAYAMHEAFADADAEFDAKEFWQTGRLDLGDGRQQVVSKQIAEGMHWLTQPMHTAWNKSASLPKMIAELTAGKEYVSFKHGAMIGPKLERGDPMAMLGYAINKATPISFSPAINAIRKGETEGMLTKTVAGAAGFPIYGKKQVEVPQY